ncbi:MAG: ABC transporter permease [Saprospiraceae bacterium]|nr:ABC transporter permease [Saprospiraceae bacterium]
MKNKTSNQPPKFFLRFFRWFCNPDFVEDLEGDLHERFARRSNSDTPNRAKWLFAKDVFSLFRPGIIKSFSPKSFLNPTVMLRHHLKLCYRQYRRSPNTFLINVIGLASGLACAIFIFLWIQDEYQIDRFHAKDQHLYQVMQNYPIVGGFETVESLPGPLAQALVKEFPEVASAITLAPPLGSLGNKGIISTAGKQVKANELYVDPEFFQFFSFPLQEGDSEWVLQKKDAVVISKKLATQLFSNSREAVGQAIEWFRGDTTMLYTISGVFDNIPAQSTLQFDLLLSYPALSDRSENLRTWANSDPHTYVLLKPGVDIEALNQKLSSYLQEKVSASVDDPNYKFTGTAFVQRFSDRYLYNRFEHGHQAGGRIGYVKLFAMIAFFLLLIACINFMNLSTAKAIHRAKEIGIKKVIGAQRSSLISQYLTEAILITLMAALVAVIVVYALLPQFNILTEKDIIFRPTPTILLALVAIIGFTGFLAGSYPALYLSKFQPAKIFKGKLTRGLREYRMRKGLVVFQFTISLVLIIAVVLVYQQINFIQNKKLGYNNERILTLKRDGNLRSQFPAFKASLEALPEIASVTTFRHDLTGDFGSTSGLQWEGQAEGHRIEFGNLEADYGLMEMMEIRLAEGRSFSSDFATERNKIIFNEAAIKAMGLKEAVGQKVMLWGEPREIIGVAEDFHFESLYEKVKPCMIRFSPNNENILIKLKSATPSQAITAIEETYHQFNEGLAFEYRFLDDDYQRLYASEQRISRLSRYFAALAIIISCLGLFGLAAFTAERRAKEISIRKILGASIASIVQLLSKDFTRTVMLALLIGIPISYLLSQYWLQSFAYHIDIQPWYFLGAGLLLLLIAWSTVGIQTIKAARTNLIQALKDE